MKAQSTESPKKRGKELVEVGWKMKWKKRRQKTKYLVRNPNQPKVLRKEVGKKAQSAKSSKKKERS